MKIDRAAAEGRNVFTGYGEGYVMVGGRRVEASVIIGPETLVAWPVSSIATLEPAHVEQVLAVELTFPTLTAGEAVAYEPWTAASRWEQALVAKVQGFGGVVLQRSPALLLVAFGIPHTLEQLPQRAVQTALTLRHLVAEDADQVACPALRLVVHWGEGLVDG